MPEINSQSQPVPSAPRFELPQRQRFNVWKILIPLLIVISLVAGWFAKAGYDMYQEIPEPVVEVKQEEPKPQASPYYYLAPLNVHSGNDTQLSVNLYNFLNSGETPDKLVKNLGSSVVGVVGKYLGRNHHVVTTYLDNKVLDLDVTNGEMKELFTMPERSSLRSVALSSDGQWLAYGRNYEGVDNGGEIYLFNPETKEQKELVKRTKLDTYVGYSVLGWRNNDKQLVVAALGGDAGPIWGDIYLVDAVTGEMVAVAPLPENQKMAFLRGSLSPDSDRWLYSICEKPGQAPDDGLTEPCPAGAELRVYDFDSKQTKVIYQNTRYGNNTNAAILRTIMSFVWQDDTTIVAAVPGGLLQLNATGSGEPVELLTYDGTDPQEFTRNYTTLFDADENLVVYQRDQDIFVFNKKTKKVTGLNLAGRQEYLAHWFE
jgi:WD40 repeat protein